MPIPAHLLRASLTKLTALAFAAVVSGATTLHPPTNEALSGDWLVTFTAPNFGDIRVYMTMATRGLNEYEAYSRPGALRQFISLRQYIVGRVLRKLPPRLAAVRLDSVRTRNVGDSIVVRALLVSQMFGTMRVMGGVHQDTLRADLRFDTTGASVGSLRAVRSSVRQPLRDYAALARVLPDTMSAFLYDPRLMRTPAWRGFFTELSARLTTALDDADVMAAFYALLPRLATSHINLTHDPRLANMSVDSALMRVSAPPESLVTLAFPAPGVARLYVRRWEQVSDAVDRAFKRIESAQAQTVILDIRGNPGGDQTGLVAAGHLFGDSMDVGVLLGNRWYRDHVSPPTPAQARSVPRSSKDNLLTTFHMLRDQGVVVFSMPTREPRFTGKVYLLLNSSTGSASEPLAYLLKQTKRATLIGERTAGAILAAVPHPVGDGWVLLLPEGDYYTADGVRLEGRGVEPDVKVPWRDALLVVADSLRAREPYAAALLAAQEYTAYVTPSNQHARSQSAERWAREAMRLGPDSIAPIAALASAFVTDQRWEVGFAALDSLLTHHSTPLPVHFQIGRLAALSGQRLDAGERSLRTYVAGPALRGAPTRAIAFWRLGIILEKKADIAAARRAYEEGLSIEPTNANLIAALRSLPTVSRP